MSTQSPQQVENERAEREMAMREVGQPGADQAVFGEQKSLLEQIGDPDIEPPATADNDDIAEILSAELSHHNALSNITREEYEDRKLLHQVIAMQVKAEYPRKAGVSSKCVGDYRRELLGDDEGSKKQLPDKLARKVEATLGEEGVKTQMTALSIGAKAFDGVTTKQSYAELSGSNGNQGSGGIMETAKSFLGFGGGDEE